MEFFLKTCTSARPRGHMEAVIAAADVMFNPKTLMFIKYLDFFCHDCATAKDPLMK